MGSGLLAWVVFGCVCAAGYVGGAWAFGWALAAVAMSRAHFVSQARVDGRPRRLGHED